jgi:multidrug efflux pump subunit AcrA (membrane-fusion protein)
MIDEHNEGTLKPGMTVSCEIIYSLLQNVHYVPNDCILRENGEYFIHVQDGGNITKTPVETGPRNNNHTVISGAFKKGQAVIPKSSYTL